MILSTKPTQWPDGMTYCTATGLFTFRCFSTSGSRLASQLSKWQFYNFALRRCQYEIVENLIASLINGPVLGYDAVQCGIHVTPLWMKLVTPCTLKMGQQFHLYCRYLKPFSQLWAKPRYFFSLHVCEKGCFLTSIFLLTCPLSYASLIYTNLRILALFPLPGKSNLFSQVYYLE